MCGLTTRLCRWCFREGFLDRLQKINETSIPDCENAMPVSTGMLLLHLYLS